MNPATATAKLFFPCALLALALQTGCVTPPRPPEIDPAATAQARNRDTGRFWWGTSTSSYQNEDRGAKPGEPGYFLTDWDLFSAEGRAAPRGEDATFSWTHFDKDVAALKRLGVSHFRFSIEWARVEPEPGVYNEQAIRRYAEMARKLRAAGIEPVVSLWHITSPAWLYRQNDKKRSHFTHEEIDARWQAYVRKIVPALAPHVRYFVPQNEANGSVALGYLGGHWPPGLLLHPGTYRNANAQAVKMFRDAVGIIKEHRADAVIVSVHSLPYWRRNFLLDPTAATYNTMMRQNYDHLDAVIDLVDIVGVNYYYSQDADIPDFLYQGRGEKASNYTQMGWEIEPEGFYNTLDQVWRRYHKPILIVENGIGTQNEQKKIKYLRDHINQVRRAIGDGIDIRGYFAWTLVDNYEWTEGFTSNFGLTYMDPKTKKRVFEPSAVFFSNVIQADKNNPMR